MTTIIAIVLMVIFLTISGVHVYWGFGGQWGNGAVLPTKDDQIKVMMPGIFPTFLVAFGLLGFGIIVILNITELDVEIPTWLNIIRTYGLWVIACIFLLRAIGEFNYVGFFKKYKHTKFGQNDTKYYSPLCLIIAILSIILALAN